MVEPKGCKNCKRGQCPLHCKNLDALIKARGVTKISNQTQKGVKMSGTY